jgi:hypothetical protein
MESIQDKIDELKLNIALEYEKSIYNLVKKTEKIEDIHIDVFENEFNKIIEKQKDYNTDFASLSILLLNEKLIIKETRDFYAEKGIFFKTAHRIKRTLQTESLEVTYSRYLLIPKTPLDSMNLKIYNTTRGISTNKNGIFPLDIVLGVDTLPHNITVNAMLKISHIAQGCSSYQEASQSLFRHGLKIDPATIMSVTNHIGRLAFNNEMAAAEEFYDYFLSGKFNYRPDKEGIVYIEMDGAFVNTRDKSEKGNSSWHENKLGLVFSDDGKRLVKRRKPQTEIIHPKYGIVRPRYVLTRKAYTSYVGSVDVFKKLLLKVAVNNGYGKYNKPVLISDGATWIKNVREELFPDAAHILDYYHLCEKVWDFSKQYFQIPGSDIQKKKRVVTAIDHPNYPKCKAWAEEMCETILQGKIEEVINIVSKKEISMKFQKDKLSTYMENNIDTTKYDIFIAKGYDIGSGAIESSNKSVLQKRLNGPGMRWHIDSAQNMVTLTAKNKSERWYEDVVIPIKKYYNIAIK